MGYSPWGHKEVDMTEQLSTYAPCPSRDEWMKKISHEHTHIYTYIHTYIHTREYFSAIKKNEILLFSITWMNLESIMLLSLKCGI